MDYNEKKQRLELFLNSNYPLKENETLYVEEHNGDEYIEIDIRIDKEIGRGVFKSHYDYVFVGKEFLNWLSFRENKDYDWLSFGENEDYENERGCDEGIRQTGRSTRLADDYIQELFENGHVKIRDHIDIREMHKELFRKIINRLESEHHNCSYSFEINNQNFAIKLR